MGKIQKCGIFVLLTMLVVYEALHMFSDEDSGSHVTSFLLIGVLVTSCLYTLNRKVITDNTYIKFRVFFIYVICLSYFCSLFTPLPSMILYISIPLILICFLVGYEAVRVVDIKQLTFLFYFAFAILALYNFTNLDQALLFNVKERNSAPSYILLYLLPLALLQKNKILSILAFVITFVALLLSMKRSGIITFAMSFLVYLYVLSKVNGKSINKFAILIVVAVGVISLFYIFTYVDDLSGGLIMGRMESIEDDGGSGRSDIYLEVISMIQKSDILSSIFGHGWYTVINDSRYQLSAHNDHLEMIYDFGYIGYGLFLSFFYHLIRSFISLFRQNSYMAPILAYSIVEFFMNTMMSHIVVYPQYMMVFTLTWGVILSIQKKYNTYINI